MTAVVAGLLIAGVSTQPGAQAFGVLLAIGGGLWMFARRGEES